MKRWKIVLPTLLATSGLPLVSLVGCGKSVSVTGVFIEQGDIVRLDTNGTKQLTAIVIPTDATDKKVTWSVDESGNASVDPETGMVTGLHDGDAVVTVTTNDGAYTDSCTVEVRDVPVTGVIIKQGTEANLSQFNTLQLECEVLPHNATNKNVIWSSDSEFASVDQNGLVSGKWEGTSNITVKTEEGSFEAKIKINVVYVQPEHLDIDQGDKISCKIGETLQLTCTPTPADASYLPVVWLSSDYTVAEVNSDTGIVLAKKPGKATISVDDVAWKCEDTIEIEVEDIPVESVKIDQGSSAECAVTGNLQLTYTIKPETVTDKSATWTSSNEDVATVDDSGLVHGLKEGDTTITVTTNNHSRTDSIVVHVVNIPVTKIELSEARSDFYTDYNNYSIEYSLEPSDASLYPKWTSSNGSVATIDEKTGKINLLAEGKTTITLTDEVTKLSDSFEINVTSLKDNVNFWFTQVFGGYSYISNLSVEKNVSYTFGVDRFLFSDNSKAWLFNFLNDEYGSEEPFENLQIKCDEYVMQNNIDYEVTDTVCFFTDAGKEKIQNCTYLLIFVSFTDTLNTLFAQIQFQSS